MEMQFKRLNLKEGDDLVIEVNTSGLSNEEAKEKLSEIRKDDFVKYVEQKGHKVFVTYTGVNLEILRMGPDDKLVAKADVTEMDFNVEKEYCSYIKEILSRNLSEEKIIVVPQRNSFPQLNIVHMEGEGEE